MFSDDFLNEEATYGFNKIAEMGKNSIEIIQFINQVISKRIKRYIQEFKTTRSFGREIDNNKLSLDDALDL